MLRMRSSFLCGLVLLLAGCSADKVMVGAPMPLPVAEVQGAPVEMPVAEESPPPVVVEMPVPAPAESYHVISADGDSVASVIDFPAETAPPPAMAPAPAPPASIPHQATVPEPERGSVSVGDAPNTTNELAAEPDLVAGSAVYQIPPLMTEQSASPVDLWVDASLSETALQKKLEEFLQQNAERSLLRAKIAGIVEVPGAATQVVSREVMVGRKMYAKLSGDQNFIIDPPGEVEKPYEAGEPFKWHWLVTPKKVSRVPQILVLEVSAANEDGEKRVRTMREEVYVEAIPPTWYERLKKWFQELDWWVKLFGGGGLGAAVVWIGNRALSRRSKP